MKRTATIAAVVLHIALAAVLYASTTNPDLPPEDVIVKRASYLNQGCQVDIYQTRADIALNGQTYILTGTAETDRYGAVSLLESPTGNAVTILPDGSADAYLNGVQHRFEFEF